jgi:hypothetical protein
MSSRGHVEDSRDRNHGKAEGVGDGDYSLLQLGFPESGQRWPVCGCDRHGDW